MNERKKFSYAKLAVCSVGAASLVLLLVTVLIGVLKPAPVLSLAIALAGVVGAIVAMGVVASRITAAAFPRASEAKGDVTASEAPGDVSPDAERIDPGQ